MNGSPQKNEQKPSIDDMLDYAANQVSRMRENSAHQATSNEPSHLGRYRAVERIGRGGMGEVFLAEQPGLPGRRFAIKRIRAGGDSDRVLKRFEYERQTLAKMTHPNIASVIDADKDEQGRPFFVMDFVNGEPITAYCRNQGLTLRQRLDLFLDVCDAVQHAHQKGVIHRDLKPSNILVEQHGNRPVPKIIDFGIAKAVEKDGDHETLTIQGQLVGTLPYMSPEQVDPVQHSEDTRSDVYSLGVLLYELLTGCLPFEFKSLSFTEIVRVIQSAPPPRPSTRLASSGSSADTWSSSGGTSVASISRLLRRDLDWVTLKCLEKDPRRRYDSISGLSADIRCFINGRPVSARPGRLYRASRFLHAHRVSIVITSTVLLAIGLVVRGEVARRIASREAAQKAAELWFSVWKRPLSKLNPDLVGKDYRVVDLLEDMQSEIGRQLADEPRAAILAHQSVGKAWESLAEYQKAHSAYTDALTLAMKTGAGKEQVAELKANVGATIGQAGDNQEAEKYLREALSGLRDSAEVTVAEVEANIALGGVLIAERRLDEAETVLQQSLQLARDNLGVEHETVGAALAELGTVSYRRNKIDPAIDFYSQALAILAQASGPESANAMGARSNLAICLSQTNRRDEALQLLTSYLATARTRYDNDHPALAATLENLGSLFRQTGAWPQAETAHREAYEIRRRFYGDNHEYTAHSLHNLAASVTQTRGNVEAEPLVRKAIEAYEKTLGPNSDSTILSVSNLGVNLLHQKRYAEAEPYLCRAYQHRQETLGEENGLTRDSLANFAVALSRSRPYDDETIDTLSKLECHYALTLGPNAGNLWAARELLVRLEYGRGDLDAAELLAREFQTERERLGRVHPDQWALLGWILYFQGKWEDVELVAEQMATSAPGSPNEAELRTHAQMLNGCALADRGKYELARPILEEAIRNATDVFAPERTFPEPVIDLGLSLAEAGLVSDAEVYLLDGFKSFQDSPGSDRWRRCRAALRIADFYERIGRPMDADTFRLLSVDEEAP